MFEREGKKMVLQKVNVFHLIVFFLICGCITAGCMQPVSIDTNQSFESTPESSGSGSIPILTRVQAEESIRSFMGVPDMELNYQGISNQNYADLYEFSAIQGEFAVNSVTGRVQDAVFYHTSSPSAEDIGLEQAYVIAETYAQEKYLELWVKSDKKGVKNSLRERTNHGNYFEYNFVWRDEYTISDPNQSKQYHIIGPNSVIITLDPTGIIKSYDERVVLIDSALVLIPDIPENQAWRIAENHFTTLGVTDIARFPEENSGLTIVNDNTNHQHLAWVFTGYNSEGYGGRISVDAHDGSIVYYLPVW
jgi:hypothetical protein